MVQEPSKEQAVVVGQEAIKLLGGAKNEKSTLKPEAMQLQPEKHEETKHEVSKSQKPFSA